MNPETPEQAHGHAPERDSETATQEEMERYEAWMAAHPVREIAAEDRRNHEREMVAFRELIAAFHAEFSIQRLSAIKHLNAEEAESHPIWQPAKRALAIIEPALKRLATETDIPEEKLWRLQGEYKKISQAVGMRRTSDGTVFHDR